MKENQEIHTSAIQNKNPDEAAITVQEKRNPYQSPRLER